jgi:hypothetical protein
MRLEATDVVIETAEGVRRVPLASVLSGLVVPERNAARVELQLSSGDTLAAEVSSFAEGEQTLKALGLDAAKRRASVPLASRAWTVIRRVGWILTTLIASLGGLGMATDGRPLTSLSAAIWLATTTAVIIAAVWLTKERAVTIGADGVLVERPFGDRFVRFEEIRTVKAMGRDVDFELIDGDLLQKLKVGRTASAATARTIAFRIVEAVRARAVGSDAAAVLALLARTGRSVSEWRAAVERLAQRTQDYRGVALSADDLMAILESPSSSEEHRIGAALALAKVGDEEHKERVRIAANTCAREPMRDALAKLAEGDFDERAIEEALADEEPAEEAKPYM